MLRFACEGDHERTPCEDYIAGQGHRSRLCEEYPCEMAYELAHCITQREEILEEINAAEDADRELQLWKKVPYQRNQSLPMFKLIEIRSRALDAQESRWRTSS